MKKVYTTDQIRNVALVSHNGAGKTTFVERALLDTSVVTRMGTVQNGSTAMDFEPEEIERQSSTSTAIAPIEWRGAKLNILDTPGYADFIGEVNAALQVVEGAFVFVEAVSGVEVGTEIVWETATNLNLPRVVVINKMDRDNVRAKRALNSVLEHLEGNFLPVQLPIGEGPTFKGVVDLLSMESRLGDDDRREPIPDELLEDAEAARLEIIEAAAETDDSLMEKYFEEDTLSDEDILSGLRQGIHDGDIIPILYAAPEQGIAVVPVLNAMLRLIPQPNVDTVEAETAVGDPTEITISNDSSLSAFIFKTREDPYGKMSYLRVYGGKLKSDSRVWNVQAESEIRIGSLQLVRGKEQLPVNELHAGDIGVVVKLDASTNDTLSEKDNAVKLPAIEQPNPIYSLAVHPVSQSDTAKLSQTITRLIDEDSTLRWHNEEATHEAILSGMGTTHLNIAVKKAKSKFGLNLTTTIPKIPYRETITKTSSAEYTHKKQTGGAGQYARVFLRVESLSDDDQFTFDSEIFGGAISAPFVAATEKGCRQALEDGVLAGYPVTGVKAIVYDGKEHPVDSKEIAFQIAGREGFKEAVAGASPVLLEPIYDIKVTVPADNMGDILGDLNTRRASVQGMDQASDKSIISAQVPLGEMQSYLADLRSMTQGRGVFRMKFSHYGRVPSHLQKDLVSKLRKERDEAH